MPVHEPAWLLLAIYLVAGCLLLAKGADWLVGGSSRLARRLGISTLAIGLTVVAWGTSAPEVVVSVLAALEGQAAISLGNVLGSNIANIGLVLGASALVLPKVLEGRLSFRDIFWLFASVGALWWCSLDGQLTRLDGALLLGLFAAYNVWLWRTSRQQDDPAVAVPEVPRGGRSPWLLALGGVAAVSVGAKLVVMGAEGGALRLGVEPRVVGLTVVAVGTSLPELAAGLGSAFKGESDISLGNVLGSNVFNVLAVLGLVALVRPLVPEATGDAEAQAQLTSAFEGALSNDFPYVMAFSLAFLVLPLLGGARLGRWKGALLLGAYTWYTVNLF
ncbi:MAG: calcium/sodium antiporter [Planctomycetaceae bacterium]|nr:calcium/sodium antiporter [Planctomycetaceae bacterium]